MKLRIEVDTNHQPSLTDGTYEANRMLARVGDAVAAGLDHGPLRDSKGNLIGHWKLELGDTAR